MRLPTSSVRADARQQEAMLQCPVCLHSSLYEQMRTTSSIYFGCYTCQGTSDFVRDGAGRTREAFIVATLKPVTR